MDRKIQRRRPSGHRRPCLKTQAMPLFQDQNIEDFPIGNRSLFEHHADLARDGMNFHPHAWLTASDLEALSSNGHRTLIDERETPLAWLGDFPSKENTLQAVDSFLIIHAWDLLRANELLVGSLQQDLDALARQQGEPAMHSGKQELFENILNQYI